jgi:flagellum-specific ATP synthase
MASDLAMLQAVPEAAAFEQAARQAAEATVARLTARVRKIVGAIIECTGLAAPVGARVVVHARLRGPVDGEIVGFRENAALVMAYGETAGVSPRDEVEVTEIRPTLRVGPGLLGRVIDALGRPLDGKGPVAAAEARPLFAAPPHPLRRQRISRPLGTGIRAIDAMLTCGRGARLGVFSGTGVGKSVLLGMMARYTDADVNVITLVGERGREVREFVERNLGPEGLARSVVVVSTGDTAAPLRVRAGLAGATVADYFREQGLDVNWIIDSVTRLAMAQREVGLSAGEPPATKGYPPSVFGLLPRLLERAGTGEKGSVTGFFAVLVEGDDLSEPISDATRGVLDGHVVLSRSLANRGHFPAIDILGSVSRVMPDVVTAAHRKAARQAVAWMAAYAEAADLIAIGAYRDGTNPDVDAAKAVKPELDAFLRQDIDEKSGFDEARERLMRLVAARLEASAAGAERPRAAAGPGLTPGAMRIRMGGAEMPKAADNRKAGGV